MACAAAGPAAAAHGGQSPSAAPPPCAQQHPGRPHQVCRGALPPLLLRLAHPSQQQEEEQDGWGHRSPHGGQLLLGEAS